MKAGVEYEIFGLLKEHIDWAAPQIESSLTINVDKHQFSQDSFVVMQFNINTMIHIHWCKLGVCSHKY
jgi:hypothetical protein